MSAVAFAGMTLLARPGRVMTPRSATEQLVDVAVAWAGERPVRVADVGTGSGAIAVALARAAPLAEIWATDTSPAAIALARLNAWRAGVSERVHVLDGDLLAPVPGGLDIVLANLPYLPLADRTSYPDLVGEPLEAVFAAGDGYGPYRRLLAAAEERLLPGGLLVLQVHRRIETAAREELGRLRAVLEQAPGALASAA